ncbi:MULTISPECIES: flagellar motor switch protein FliM [Acetobacter]|uniref:Flagellar motor switch protein FliM n=1 Tax=Acetobacter lovaniensis TaxID=104100 RepID=A0A841QFK0_9PROT|nr:flagellar motor switch protein FliM [Acetobacter lovaniensis]MBB6457188.1 flagellar motor switch protein FliM [Acetobacter lovaniensis]NHN81233.1 flagellar motor switch protein FliM [Acetobacter lovaniensis]GBQ63225.1 flagellar motor switch protein FliM [Acetobacter lovaniensis NRIC 0474]
MQDVDDTASGPGNQPEADAAPDAPQTEEAQDGAQERTPDAAASTAGRTDPAQEQDTADTAAPPQDDAPAHDAQDAHAEQGEQGEHEATPEEDPFGSHLLDQSEIDNLLGHTFGGFEEPEETGMERVIKAGFVAYERLPMLEIVFDRLVRILSATLRNFTNDNVEITIEGIRSLRFGDYMGAVPSSSMFAVFKAVQWDNYGLVVVDSAMSYSIIDILMGGPRGVGHAGVETRPHTAIERALIEKLITLTLNDLSIAFNPVCDVDLTFERLEVSSRFAAIARASNAVVLAKLHIDMEDRTGNMDLIIPYATLEPVRDQLSQQFMGEKFGRDSIWEDHLFSEILETDAQVSAVFDEKIVPLSEVLNLKIGSLMTFPHKQGAPFPIRLQCGQTPLFDGRLGKLGNKNAVKIERRLVPPQDHHLPPPLGVLPQPPHPPAANPTPVQAEGSPE